MTEATPIGDILASLADLLQHVEMILDVLQSAVVGQMLEHRFGLLLCSLHRCIFIPSQVDIGLGQLWPTVATPAFGFARALPSRLSV